jgi:hypothetical protein
VSPRTIERDAQVAEAVSAIGRESPDAKRKILSGSAGISRKQLRELSSGPDGYIAHVAASIDGGTFVAKASGVLAPSDVEAHADSGRGEVLPFERAFNRITDDFSFELRNLLSSDDTGALRQAFRSYIGMLEDLYSTI